MFLKKWNNETSNKYYSPPYNFNSPHRGLSPHKCKKKFCPHKILRNFQIKSPIIMGGGAETMPWINKILLLVSVLAFCILGICNKSISLFNSWSNMLADFNNFFNFSALEWPNWQWSFFAILFFSSGYFEDNLFMVNNTLSDSLFLWKWSKNCSVLLISMA